MKDTNIPVERPAFICQTTTHRDERTTKSRSFTFYLDRLQDLGLELEKLEAICLDGEIHPPYPYQWCATTKLRDGEDDCYLGIGGSPLEALRVLYKEAKEMERHKCISDEEEIPCCQKCGREIEY